MNDGANIQRKYTYKAILECQVDNGWSLCNLDLELKNLLEKYDYHYRLKTEFEENDEDNEGSHIRRSTYESQHYYKPRTITNQ